MSDNIFVITYPAAGEAAPCLFESSFFLKDKINFDKRLDPLIHS